MSQPINFHSLLEDREEPITWLLPGRIAQGTITVLDGRKGDGKSLLAAWLSAYVTTGTCSLGWAPERDPARVLWLTGEESYSQTVIPRLRAVGARLGSVQRPQASERRGRVHLTFPSGIPILEEYSAMSWIRLIVMDSLFSCIDYGLNVRDEREMRPCLEALSTFAEEWNIAILAIRNPIKAKGMDWRDAGSGSACISAIARSLMRAERHPDDPERRCLVQVATNLGPVCPTLTYKISPAEGGVRIEWDGEDERLTEAALAAGAESIWERTARQEATDWLRSLLESGPKSWEEVQRERQRVGIAERTLLRAKHDLSVVSRQHVLGSLRQWQWLLPGVQEIVEEPTPLEVATVEPPPKPPPKPRKPRKRKEKPPAE